MILNIESSPRAKDSASIAVTEAFLAEYCLLHPGVEVDTLNVWDEHLPDFDSEAIGAKYKGVSHEQMDSEEAEIWGRIHSLVERFQRADRIVLGVPMWNFAFPYKLKQLVDLVCQRRFLFSFEDGMYGPLLKTPLALVVYTRGQAYSEKSPTPRSFYDYQTGYIEFWLRFIGVQQIYTLTVEDTWSNRGAAAISRGQAEARCLAVRF